MLQAADEANIPFLSSALTFDALMAAVPLLLILLTALSVFLQATLGGTAPTDIASLFQRFFPTGSGGAGGGTFAAIAALLERIREIGWTVTLVAAPLFLLTGHLMNQSGATDRIFEFADAVVGHVRGGLGHVNVIGSMIFAGMSGSGTADAAGLGAIEIKAMREAGYDDKFTIGVTAGSSLIGPIIPPSIPAILFAILADVSVGRVLLGGAIPGVLMGVAMMLLVAWYAWRRGYPQRPFSGLLRVWRSFLSAFASLLTPVILIGGIIFGFFTATEAAGVASLWAIILSVFIYRTVGLARLVAIFRVTTQDSAIIMFILACSSLFGWILTRTKTPDAIAHWLAGLSTDPGG